MKLENKPFQIREKDLFLFLEWGTKGLFQEEIILFPQLLVLYYRIMFRLLYKNNYPTHTAKIWYWSNLAQDKIEKSANITTTLFLLTC